MIRSNLAALLVVGAVGVATFQNWSAIKGVAASAGVDLSSAIGGVFPGMHLDSSQHDPIEDRRGPMGDLPGRIGPASFPGGFGRGRFPGGGYAQGEPPPMPDGSRCRPGGFPRGGYAQGSEAPPMPGAGDDQYQGHQGGELAPMPYPPGRSSRRPPPGGPVDDSSDWWDDQHFHTERGQGHWRDCGPGGRRCGPWVDGPAPGDPIREDPKWRR